MGTIPLQDSWSLVVVNLVFKLNVELKQIQLCLKIILFIDMMEMASILFVKSFFFFFGCMGSSKAWNCWRKIMINNILQSLLLTYYFAVFNVVNYINFECRNNNPSEHNMIPYFQLISCLELFPSILNVYFGWPIDFAFSNTHSHVFDLFVYSSHCHFCTNLATMLH